ncbi:hypothetical protein GIB67_032497 [Kingdonia uniflora]|uniref:Uncharacterized protein n=1 Tax=Kingdonia uniflora TaxID=39325 RepID=A0A7J7L7P4_9MAGN|nr:hypothetical protein GIB67_032497 [Kingdonia uniflora]
MEPVPAEDTEVFRFLVDDKEAGLKGEGSCGDRLYASCELQHYCRYKGICGSQSPVRRERSRVVEWDVNVVTVGKIGDVDGYRVECMVYIQHCAPRFGLERDDARRVGL